jgi:hypothetical protein
MVCDVSSYMLAVAACSCSSSAEVTVTSATASTVASTMRRSHTNATATAVSCIAHFDTNICYSSARSSSMLLLLLPLMSFAWSRGVLLLLIYSNIIDAINFVAASTMMTASATATTAAMIAII